MCSLRQDEANEPHLASRWIPLRALKIYVGPEYCMHTVGTCRQELKSSVCIACTVQVASGSEHRFHAEGVPDCVAGHVAARADLIRAHCEARSSQTDTRAIAVHMSQIWML